MKISRSMIALAIILAIVLIGEVFAYMPYDHRGFSSDVVVGDDISYSVTAKGAYDYSVIVIDNHGMRPVDSLYIYLDKSYAVASDETVFTAVGAQPFTQEYYIDQLTKNLEFRGFDDITIVDTDGLKDVLKSNGHGKGIVMVSGAVPDVFLEDDVLIDWIDAGGYLYWVGEEIGKYSSSRDGLKEIGLQEIFVGTDVFSDSKASATVPNEDAHRLCIQNQFVRYLPDLSRVTDRDSKGFGFSDGTCSTIEFVQMGEGQVCIVGGDFASMQLNDLAICISAGLTYRSEIVHFAERTFRDSDSGKISLDVEKNGLSVFVSIGKYHCAYAERYDL